MAFGADAIVFERLVRARTTLTTEGLEHRAEKWIPVFRKNDATSKEHQKTRATCVIPESRVSL